MATVLDKEGILHGGPRYGHRRKDLSRSVSLGAQHPSHEVGANAVVVEQLSPGGARVQESLGALSYDTPLLALPRERRGFRHFLPSVVASRAGARDEAPNASSGSTLDTR